VLTCVQHRDLHENNVCIAFPLNNIIQNLPEPIKYGRSGMEVTLIDYGLSRATIPKHGDVVFSDLEQDLALFHSVGTTPCEKLQFNNYRL
jgi:serine/threonine-protein kinase haspin